MSKPLNRTTAQTPLVYPERIVQFGGGNFLRAFVDWMVEKLNTETDFGGSVVIVKPTPHGDYAALEKQDGLFHVALHGLQDGQLVTERQLITCVSRSVHPYQNYDAYLAIARQPELRFIVSNTTEAGIAFNADDTVDAQPPDSFPAKLTQFLYHRYQHFAGQADKGCIILPCELIDANGAQLKQVILQYVESWKLDSDFVAWLDTANVFCNTLVDRIVTGFPQQEREAEALQAIGYDDRVLVEGEQYHSWIIEAPDWIRDEFPVQRCDLNVKIVHDLTPHRTVKVRILNGAHTSMVPIGYLLGLESVREAIENPALGVFIQQLIFDEVIPYLDVDVPETELTAFANDVMNRFRNPFLHHRLLSIALNSVSKFKTRLLPSLIAFVEKQEQPPERIVFALAALLRFYQGEWQGQPIPLQDDDDIITRLQIIWQSDMSLTEKVTALLQDEASWGMDLAAIDGLVERVTQDITRIEADGVRAVLETLAQG